MDFYLKHLIFLLLIIYFIISTTEQCSSSGYQFENYLSTMTPYRVVSNKSLSKVEYEGCSPRKIWMVVRHGTRNPSISNIEKMQRLLPEIKELILENDRLPNEFIKNRDLDLFRKWKINLDVKDEKKLTHEGEEEMLLLAERMQNRYPEIFDNVYSNTSFKFKYTFSQRTKKSAYYFAAGLFGKKTAKEVWFPEPLDRDPILRFYKLCEKWTKNIKKNPKTMEEKKAFESGPKMLGIIKNIQNRINVKDLSTGDLVTMYRTCAFETAWNKISKSPWCTPFTEDDLKALEYLEDLKYYWQDGYGHNLTYDQACVVFGDMINFLASKETYPKATIYFTHSGTLLKMLAHLGLYKEDEHLKAQNYNRMINRKWRTGVIDSFATNLGFILFKCGKEKKILTMHQENIIRLPSCPDTDLCDIKRVNSFYSQSTEKCDFKSMCSLE